MTLIARRSMADLQHCPSAPWRLTARSIGSSGLLLAGVYASVHWTGLIPWLAVVAAATPLLMGAAWQFFEQRLREPHPAMDDGGNRRQDEEPLSSATIGFILKDIDMSPDARHELVIALMSAIGSDSIERLAQFASDSNVHSAVRLEIATMLLEKGLPDGRESLAALVNDEAAEGEDRFMAASLLWQQRDDRALPGLWTIARSSMKDGRARLDAAVLLATAERKLGSDPRAFRAFEHIANDQRTALVFRRNAIECLAKEHAHRAAIALWNMMTEPSLPAQAKLRMMHRLKSIDVALAASGYRLLAYDPLLPMAIRIDAADRLRELREADGVGALRDLLQNQDGDLDLKLGILRRLPS